MRILVAPDKMKGSLSANEIADIFEMQLSFIYPDWQVISKPLADGGDGSLDVVSRTLPAASKMEVDTYNAIMNPISSYYLLDDQDAYVELAKQSGLAQLKLWERNPLLANTYGTGYLIHDAIKKGAKVIHLFVGGSATNDLGLGILAGLGFTFYDNRGEEFIPAGGTLNKIDHWKVNPDLASIQFYLYCDVDNPLLGPEGAAQSFGCQKGANEAEIQILETQTQNFLKRLRDVSNQSFDEPMDGASGGIAVGLKAFLQTETMSGIEYFIRLFDIEKEIELANAVVSAEGKIDKTSVHNKTIAGVGKICKKYAKPLYLFCGSSTLREEDLNDFNVKKIMELRTPEMSLDESKAEARSLLSTRINDSLELLHSEETVLE